MSSTNNEKYYEININGMNIPYTLVKSSHRRSISIRIDIGGKMTVKSPYFISKGMVERFIYEKQDWIYKHYVEAVRKATEAGLVSSRNPGDEGFGCFGNNVFSGNAGDFDTLHSHTQARAKEDATQVNKHKKYARNIFEARVAYFQQFTGGTYNSISIRDQKTRWGSCSGRGNLSFNWRLILAPPEILDYVVVHELCHLTYMNHSKEFWGLVSKVLPDYKERRKWLKDKGHTLHL